MSHAARPSLEQWQRQHHRSSSAHCWRVGAVQPHQQRLLTHSCSTRPEGKQDSAQCAAHKHSHTQHAHTYGVRARSLDASVPPFRSSTVQSPSDPQGGSGGQQNSRAGRAACTSSVQLQGQHGVRCAVCGCACCRAARTGSPLCVQNTRATGSTPRLPRSSAYPRPPLMHAPSCLPCPTPQPPPPASRVRVCSVRPTHQLAWLRAVGAGSRPRLCACARTCVHAVVG